MLLPRLIRLFGIICCQAALVVTPTSATPSTTADAHAAPTRGNGSFTRGNNSRMTQAQAVILTQQFDKLVKETAICRANADYRTAMDDIIVAIRKVQAHSAALAKAGRVRPGGSLQPHCEAQSRFTEPLHTVLRHRVGWWCTADLAAPRDKKAIKTRICYEHHRTD